MRAASEKPQSVGRKIRRLRLERDWTQAELGKKAGIDGKNVSSYETGSLRASDRTLQRFSQAFEMSLDEFLSDVHSNLVATIDDPDLLALFQEVSLLPEAERTRTKWILGTIVKQNIFQQVVAS